MASQYLGKVTGLITQEDLSTLTSVTTGSVYRAGDIEWLKFIADGKTLLIAKDSIRTNISWDYLNSKGLVYGKQLRIGDVYYKCRLIKGADTDPNNLGQYLNSEWNKLLIDLVGSSNFTHYVYTYCQETYTPGNAVLRGDSGNASYISADSKSSYSWGWRPVLEITNTKPTFSISNSDLGKIANFTPIQYSVSDAEDSILTITEKINENIIRTLTNQPSGTNYTLDLASVWDSLNWGKHTIEIIADDGKGLDLATITIIFDKIKIHTLPIETTPLKGLIDHFDNIAKDVDYERIRLAQRLISKQMEVSETDKMSNLIDKVGDIKTIKSIVAGDSWRMFYYKNEYESSNSTTYVLAHTFTVGFGGSVRGKGNIYAYQGGHLKINHERGVQVIKTCESWVTNSSAMNTLIADFPDVLKGDKINFYVKAFSNGIGRIAECSVSCDFNYS